MCIRDSHGTAHLPLKPKTKVAIVTCMDSRLHVAQALGLALGDAHISVSYTHLRNIMFEVANSPLNMRTKTSPMAKIKAKTKRERAGIPVAITSAPIIPTACLLYTSRCV